MAKTVLVVGATGRVGRAACSAFRSAGWHVRAFVRRPHRLQASEGLSVVVGDAKDAARLVEAATGAQVIVHALNLPYPQWERQMSALTRHVILAARASGAAIVLPGNVYSFGANMPERLTEETPHHPTQTLGQVRKALEEDLARAAAHGVQTIVLRAGDFIDVSRTGNWFDAYVVTKARRGRTIYPGPTDRVHAWAYLPDVARAMVSLTDMREQLAQFEVVHFEGYTLTGQELVELIARATGVDQHCANMPWRAMRLLRWCSPMIRAVVDMSYLWRVPHRLDGAKFARLLPDFVPTPVQDAIQCCLPE